MSEVERALRNDPKVLVQLEPKERDEVRFYAEIGMPVSGDAARAVKRVVDQLRKENQK